MIATTAIHLFGAAALAAAFVLLTRRRLPAMRQACAAQSAAVAAAAACAAWAQGSLALAAVAAGMVASAVLVMLWPAAESAGGASLRPARTAAFGVALVALAVAAARTARPAGASVEDLAVALAVVLLGGLAMLVRGTPCRRAVGLIAAANGVALAAIPLGTGPALPLPAADLSALVVLLPLLAAAVVAVLPSVVAGGWLLVGTATATFAVTCALPWQAPAGGGLLRVDALAAGMALLAGFVAMTGAWVARSWLAGETEAGRLDAAQARRCLALYTALLGSLMLALLAGGPLLTWAGLALSTAILAAAVAVTGPHRARGAAWRLAVPCGFALTLALLGTLLLVSAAAAVQVPGSETDWAALTEAAPHGDGAVLTLALVLLLCGYGALAGLVPLHGCSLALTEGPAPLAGVLGGLLPVAALATLLRCRSLVGANPQALPPGPLMMALGLASVLVAGFAAWRQRDLRRLLGVYGVSQAGTVAFAFGIGGPAATFAGLLHLTLATLLRTALLHGVGRAEQIKGTRDIAALGGLLRQHRALGGTLAAGLVALAGLPPFGLFTSQFLIVMDTTRQWPLLAVPLLLGGLAGAAALTARLLALARGTALPDHGPAPPPAADIPAWLHLALVAVLGLAMPAAVVEWLARIVEQVP